MPPEELPLLNHGCAGAAPHPRGWKYRGQLGMLRLGVTPHKAPTLPAVGGSVASPTPRVRFGACRGIAGGWRD